MKQSIVHTALSITIAGLAAPSVFAQTGTMPSAQSENLNLSTATSLKDIVAAAC